MQKKLIALAIAGLSSAAFAQSNVTISGQMKLHFDSVSAGGCSGVGCTNLNSRTRVSDNNSNIRFSGEESLGGGNAAFFQIESAIGTDNNVGTTGAATAGAGGSTNSTGIGTRNTAVGLKGGWGMALMGKWDAHYNSMASVDGAGLVDGLPLAANSLNIFHTINGLAGVGGRLNNVVAYATPNFSGFSALLAYTTSPLTSAESTAATTGVNGGRKDQGYLINPKYENGPIAISYSYLNAKNTTTTNATLVALAGASTNNIDLKSNRLGAAYTFPMGLKVGLMWDKSKGELNAVGVGALVAAGTYVQRTAWALPIQYRTGPHTINFTYAKARDLQTNLAGGLPNTNAKNTILAYSYALSKRTDVNVTWSAINNAAAGQYDFWHPSSNVSGGTGLAVGQAGADPRMFAVGMRHAF